MYYIFYILRSFVRKYALIAGKLKFYSYKKLFRHISFGENIKVSGVMYMALDGNGIIGNNVVFNNHTRFNYSGIKAPSSIRILQGAFLEIGDNTGFSGTSIFCSIKIKIGSNCAFGVNTCIWDTDFHQILPEDRLTNDLTQIKRKPINIGDNVFVGANSIILKGVTIGEGSVIGAGSVVSKDIPPYTIAAGNPARVIKLLRNEK